MEVVLLSREELEGIKYALFSIDQKIEKMTNDNRTGPLLSNKQACGLLHVSIRTLQTYRDSGQIEFYQVGRKIVYREESILKFLQNHINKTFLKYQK